MNFYKLQLPSSIINYIDTNFSEQKEQLYIVAMILKNKHDCAQRKGYKSFWFTADELKSYFRYLPTTFKKVFIDSGFINVSFTYDHKNKSRTKNFYTLNKDKFTFDNLVKVDITKKTGYNKIMKYYEEINLKKLTSDEDKVEFKRIIELFQQIDKMTMDTSNCSLELESKVIRFFERAKRCGRIDVGIDNGDICVSNTEVLPYVYIDSISLSSILQVDPDKNDIDDVLEAVEKRDETEVVIETSNEDFEKMLEEFEKPSEILSLKEQINKINMESKVSFSGKAISKNIEIIRNRIDKILIDTELNRLKCLKIASINQVDMDRYLCNNYETSVKSIEFGSFKKAISNYLKIEGKRFVEFYGENNSLKLDYKQIGVNFYFEGDLLNFNALIRSYIFVNGKQVDDFLTSVHEFKYNPKGEIFNQNWVNKCLQDA